MDDKELQEKYLQLQLLQAQLEEYQKEVEAIRSKLEEVEYLRESLKEFDNKQKQNSYSIIGKGIFVESDLKKDTEFLVNVGANILVKKDTKDVLKMLEEQQSQLGAINAGLTLNTQHLQAKALEIQKELQSALSKSEK